MKKIVLSIVFCLSTLAMANEVGFSASFQQPEAWGAELSKQQICWKFRDDHSTYSDAPAYVLLHIPENAVDVVFAYNDTDYEHMNFGGHGQYGYHLPQGVHRVNVPAVKGEQDELPEGFFVVSKHLSKDWSGTGGVYLPPCSGGQGHHYTVTVTVRDATGHALAKRTLALGQY